MHRFTPLRSRKVRRDELETGVRRKSAFAMTTHLPDPFEATTMKRIGAGASIRRCTLFAAVLAVVITSGSLGFAQGSEGWAIDQVQRAVRARIATREAARDVR